MHLTQNLTLGPFENVTISGLLKGPVKQSVYYKRVNVSVQPLEDHKEGESKFCAVADFTFIKPSSQLIHIMIKNLPVCSLIVNQCRKISNIAAANAVPHMLAPQTPPETETIPVKSV